MSAHPRLGLPAWTYTSRPFYDLERSRVLAPSWQLACHVSDVAEPGDYFVFEFLGESVIVLRGDDGELRGFFNVCRHRAARLLDNPGSSPAGHCSGGRLRCPYHAWTYDLRGRLRSVPREAAYGAFDKGAWGLKPVSLEVWQGFVFIALEPPSQGLAEMLAPVAAELEGYRIEDMKPLGRITLRPREVNWKVLVDNYADGLHIPVAHPGLRSLLGQSYRLENLGPSVLHMCGDIDAGRNPGWSQRLYRRLLPEASHLPEERRRGWFYYLIWPNLALDIYPDQIDFMQMLPAGPRRTLIREIAYGHPGSSREMRAARYLNWRINRVVNAEDTELIDWVQAGMESRGFEQGPLSADETCLQGLAERLREILPLAAEPVEPPDM